MASSCKFLFNTHLSSRKLHLTNVLVIDQHYTNDGYEINEANVQITQGCGYQLGFVMVKDDDSDDDGEVDSVAVPVVATAGALESDEINPHTNDNQVVDVSLSDEFTWVVAKVYEAAKARVETDVDEKEGDELMQDAIRRFSELHPDLPVTVAEDTPSIITPPVGPDSTPTPEQIRHAKSDPRYSEAMNEVQANLEKVRQERVRRWDVWYILKLVSQGVLRFAKGIGEVIAISCRMAYELIMRLIRCGRRFCGYSVVEDTLTSRDQGCAGTSTTSEEGNSAGRAV